jgi:capsular exopolysaccharide synthesis family protein
MKAATAVKAPQEKPAKSVKPAKPEMALQSHVESGAYRIAPSVVTLSAPLTAGAEAVRALRTHILSQHVNVGRRSLAICGASAGVGCSFVAVNLAVALAQVGLKTMLIDGDLREPSLDQFIIPPTPPRGLTACLLDPESQVSDFVDEEVVPNLSVLYGGSPAQNAQELLARDWFEDVSNLCLREHDVTIFDTPPANTFSDARRIADIAGYALIVARRNRTLVADLKILVDQLTDDGVTVIGTLMNAD